ncbi:MAG: hypothetical protein AB1714_30050 [Acidobacteriota bacterium]
MLWQKLAAAVARIDDELDGVMRVAEAAFRYFSIVGASSSYGRVL